MPNIQSPKVGKYKSIGRYVKLSPAGRDDFFYGRNLNQIWLNQNGPSPKGKDEAATVKFLLC